MLTWIKKNAVTLLLAGVMLIGAGLIAYPSFSDWWNSYHQSRAVDAYIESVSRAEPKNSEKMLQEAEEYNRQLEHLSNQWFMSEERKASYEKLLALNGSDIMGYLTIDKIGVRLPIHHGTDESVLQVAIGHIAETSLPVGGPGTHCVVSGHRGLPSARLFTDIDKLVIGDCFTLSVLGREMTYEVDQIVTVLPTEMEELQIVPGKDYCTLLTCTPYGINTHRLLVRGKRIANQVKQEAEENETPVAQEETAEQLPIPIFMVVLLAIFGVQIVILMICFIRNVGKNKRHGKTGE